MLYTKAKAPSVQFCVWMFCKHGCIICRREINQVEFKPHSAHMCYYPTAICYRPTFIAWWLHSVCSVIWSILCEAASLGPSALADILVLFWGLLISLEMVKVGTWYLVCRLMLTNTNASMMDYCQRGCAYVRVMSLYWPLLYVILSSKNEQDYPK